MRNTPITLKPGFIGIGAVLLLLLLWLKFGLLAQPATGESHLVPTPVGAAIIPTLPTSTQPTSTPNPTTRAVNDLRTPLPNARVRIGPVSIATGTPTTAPVTYTIRTAEINGLTHLYVRNTQTNEELRLGNDQGSAIFKAINARYVIWLFACHGCRTAADGPLQSGLYAYNLTTRTQTAIALYYERGPVGSVKLSTDWVAYHDSDDGLKGRLFAYHIPTRTEVLIEDELWLSVGGRHAYAAMPHDLFAIANHTVAWAQSGIHLYDLTTGTTRTLPLPELLAPTTARYPTLWTPNSLSTSDTVVVWASMSRWWGYDFVVNELFAISTIPPGWERVANAQAWNMQLIGDQLVWPIRVTLADGSSPNYIFTAPVSHTSAANRPAPYWLYLPVIGRE